MPKGSINMSPKRSERLHRCGHAGGHLRGALLEALEYRWEGDGDWWNHIEIDFYSECDNRWFAGCSPKRRAQWLLGQLWHCTDIVPGLVRQELEDEGHNVGTYARLVRLLAEDLKPAKEGAA
jgi:hypothetical protein